MRLLRAIGTVLAIAAAITLTPVGAVSTAPATPSWGLGFHVSDANSESFWQAHMQPQDQVTAVAGKVGFLVGAVPGTRVVYTTDPSQVSATISTARQNGLTWVGLDDQTTTNCAKLAADEAAAARLVHAAGDQLLFIPEGVAALLPCYPSTPQLVTQADRIIFQAQDWQDSNPNFVADIHSAVSGLRALAPSHQVWVQLSANPPNNPKISVQELTSQIQSVQNGSSSQADGITIWYTSSRLSTVEQTVLAFRPSGALPQAIPVTGQRWGPGEKKTLLPVHR
jgi:hypothetical protein